MPDRVHGPRPQTRKPPDHQPNQHRSIRLHQPTDRFPLRVPHPVVRRHHERHELCVKDADGQTCQTRAQVDAVPAASAAAGAGPATVTAPSGPSVPVVASPDSATTTTEVESTEAAGSQDTHTETAGSEPGSAEAESGQPTVAPQDDSTATAEPAEADAEQELAPANDNAPVEPTPATGTDG